MEKSVSWTISHSHNSDILAHYHLISTPKPHLLQAPKYSPPYKTNQKNPTHQKLPLSLQNFKKLKPFPPPPKKEKINKNQQKLSPASKHLLTNSTTPNKAVSSPRAPNPKLLVTLPRIQKTLTPQKRKLNPKNINIKNDTKQNKREKEQTRMESGGTTTTTKTPGKKIQEPHFSG